VASSYFYEHIALEDRPRLLSEIRRVLRPRGRVVFLFDVASFNPLFRWLRRDAETFHQCFVEHDHHYGLETASANVERFEAEGFRVLSMHLANKTPVQHLAVYEWCRPYKSEAMDWVWRVSKLIAGSPNVNRAYGVALTLLDDVVEPFLPMDWSRIMLVALEKQS
jgi:hypothetical protein